MTAPGAVIPPRETIADIVPDAPKLVVEAHVPPEDIDRVRRDQEADIRFTAFNMRTTPLVPGKVKYVSADRMTDRASNQAYYVAQIEVDADALKDDGQLRLQAGMPAEVYLRGEERPPCNT
ncbi:HlyD family secretion protein [Caldimonas tepidiphila]|uniref:HlyD family efflux transporter periplasmic adaptor subunit n=1 Tax=Caldimonas tepidiphila TaxID=2315841 RepID=UPI001F0BDEA7|nr:HlyD family secretion protein [Caldimonas tepidiphila]